MSVAWEIEIIASKMPGDKSKDENRPDRRASGFGRRTIHRAASLSKRMLRSRSVTVKIGFVARRRSVSRSLVRRSFLGAAPVRVAAGLARLRADAFRDVPRAR
jgi:hypothetical protein